MTNFIVVAETNPVRFILEVCERVKQGWMIDTLRCHGSMTVTGSLFEVYMFDDVPELYETKGSVYEVDAHSPNVWLEHVANAVRNGYELVVDSIEWDNVGKKKAILVDGNDELNIINSKEALDSLSWKSLKELAEKVGAERNRLRSVATNNIVKKLNERRALLKMPLIDN